jgi:hypothetical protein
MMAARQEERAADQGETFGLEARAASLRVCKTSVQQLDLLIDMIVEAVVREIEEENSILLVANAAPPTKEPRHSMENQLGNSN